jgi:hypothetical protein
VRAVLLIFFSIVLVSCRRDESRSIAPASSRSDTAIKLPAASAGVVEVLNGTGRKGVANAVAERLRREGFDVVKIGNAPEKTYARTVVAERRDADPVAERVAAVLGVRGACPFRNENLLVDATVFVGRDIEEILPQ